MKDDNDIIKVKPLQLDPHQLKWIVSIIVDQLQTVGMVYNTDPGITHSCTDELDSHAASIIAGENVLVIRESGRTVCWK